MKVATRVLMGILLISLAAFIGCGGGDEESASNPLIGTWSLSTENGEPLPDGASATLVITETRVTMTIISPDEDCEEAYDYTKTADVLTATLTSQLGTQCDPDAVIGESEDIQYSISGNTLTLIFEEDGLNPQTSTLVFIKET